MQTQEIKQFYDKFNVGEKTNKRHMEITNWLIRFGLKPDMNILEIGCGPGTVSALVANYLSRDGRFTGIDISAERIKYAKQKLAHMSNVLFLEADFNHYDKVGTHDVIFLADVLEHIPAEDHPALMQKIYDLLSPDGFVLLHIPDPLNLDSIRAKHPEKLQPIDQSLYLPHLADITTQSGFYITHLQSYRVWRKPIEYQVICLKKRQHLVELLEKY